MEELKKLEPKITIVSAEDILPFRDKRYAKLIEEARESETWKIRAALDSKALDDLRSGRYWKNPPKPSS